MYAKRDGNTYQGAYIMINIYSQEIARTDFRSAMKIILSTGINFNEERRKIFISILKCLNNKKMEYLHI